MRGKAFSDTNAASCRMKRGYRRVSPFAVFHLIATRHLHASLLIGFLLLLSSSGCGFFSTRDPDPPTGTQGGSDLALTDRDVLELIASSFTLRDPDLYMGVISGEFTYAPLPSAYPDDPTFFANWDASREDVFIRTLLSVTLLPPDSLAQITFESISEQQWADSSIFQERYTLDLHTLEGGLPRSYSGLMRVTLAREEDGGWRISRWEDEAVSGETFTISQLRAAL